MEFTVKNNELLGVIVILVECSVLWAVVLYRIRNL
jgi:hypothetical protein